MTPEVASEPARSKAEKFWDRLARTWGRPSLDPEATDTKPLAKTRPYLRPSDTVLDYGCAMGSVDLRLADSVKAIHGIDISSRMIAAAREAAEARGVTNVTFTKATIYDDDLAKGSFNVVLAFAILHLLEDAPNALRRIAELLKPGGVLISVTPCLGERGSLFVGAPKILARIASATRLIPRLWRCDRRQLVESMEAAGLVTVEIDELVHSIPEYFVVARKA
jgi:2-polyprenyl-3-methyl-5-hydroxy-6-metoxy-1,4-benzoquinol methylase